MKLDLNDPKLTAFALGELKGQEEMDMQARIEKDPEAKHFVEQTRSIARSLEEELGREAQPRLSVAQREKVLHIRKSRWFWTFASLAVAAAVVVVVVVGPMRDQLTKKPEPALAPVREGEPLDTEGLVEESVPHQISSPIEAKKETRKADKLNENVVFDSVPMEVEHDAASADMLSVQTNFNQKTPAAAPAAPGGSAGVMSLSRASESTKIGFGSPMAGQMVELQQQSHQQGQFNTESYSSIQETGFRKVQNDPLSTFSIDVDTASYANARRFIENGSLPPKDSVRIEEFVNYFNYNYAPPTDGKPFAVHVEVADSPWKKDHQLVRIGLKGHEMLAKERPRFNLVFLVDVSGSMMDANKLPLLQKSLGLLVDQMKSDDRISIVTYAGASGRVLAPTSGSQKQKIKDAINNMTAGGSTNGGAGIELAYRTAQENFSKNATNRVILASDGDFNVGMSSEGELVRLIETKAKTGVFLSVLGFGTGNFKDSNMEKLADKGNGNYSYIDGIQEAKKVLVEQMTGTLVTIAKDVKIQVEFNPAYVDSYRLVGYENRALNKEDFNDDKKDAGEIGAGHAVTALYEILPAGKGGPSNVDALKYAGGSKAENKGADNGELLNVKVRYKKPKSDVSTKFEVPVKTGSKAFESASSDFQFAAAVAGFGLVLRDSQFKGDMTFDKARSIAKKNTEINGKEDEYREELVELIRKARKLQASQPSK